MVLIILVLGIVLFDLAAWRWGVDSSALGRFESDRDQRYAAFDR